MSNEENFSPSEWEIVKEAPFLIGIIVSDYDLNAASSDKEFDAILSTFGDAQDKYKDNQLIQAVIDEMGGFSNVGRETTSRLNANEYFTRVANIVDERAEPGEAKEFREFLYETAENTAKAFGEGFLGLGNKISEKEAYILRELKKALRV